ncbi:MAG TPA: ATP-binding cassette domain-containing protein [Candidatus Thermoplasmatota archaeon]|nr:ATP-binding cassette domain-containing protein [Candidatus Thermoplasmatota archaeon]
MPPAGKPVIEVRDLQKTYPDGTAAVKGISFSVMEGEIFGFLGPNGAGKTTSMRILGTLHSASGGSATVLGHDVERQSKQVKERIGFAMQEIGMDDLATAQEMLVLHAKLYGISGREAQEKAARLLDTFDLTPHKDRRVTRFSGGMQRRLDLAVSLIHTPEVLFLDEPSTGLDPKSRSDLWTVLRRLRDQEKITILMSTHYMEEADALCDRIAIMSKGVIAAIDTPTNLKRGVGADTVRITLAEPMSSAQWTELQRVFRPANVKHEGQHLDIRVKDGARSLVPALRIVTDLGIQVRETKVMTPTLEDVFLKYTGAKLSGEEKHAEAEANGMDQGDKKDKKQEKKRRKRSANVKISDEKLEPTQEVLA